MSLDKSSGKGFGVSLMTWLWWAPLAAVTLHIAEEFVYPGGFAAWDRSYRPAIRKSITGRLHILVNAALLLVCLQVGVLSRTPDTEARIFGVAVWLTIAALLFSNTVFHVIGTIRTKTYSPGVVTGVALYVPMAAFGYWHFLYERQVSWLTAAVAAMVGSSYHLWAALLHRTRMHHAGE